MIDQVEIEVVAGKGGDGAVSFHREKFTPRGGPDGGDGGRGGDVIIRADRRRSTLDAFSDRRSQRAQDGIAGGVNQRKGAAAPSMELRVPVGTVIYDLETDEVIADLTVEGMAAIVARGGRGGRGNKRFANSTRQAPRFAQRGALGQKRWLRLDLKLLADVGLVGLPNAGKSTLLTAWSRARPKIAAYPFTTLDPELGVVLAGGETFVAADMPGLIEGASQGVGLGHEFLRHIERTRVLVHVLDMTREEPLEDFAMINGELHAFGHGLSEKPQIVALNKIDDPDGRARVELLEREIAALGFPYRAISAAAGEGTQALAALALTVLRQAQDAEAVAESEAIPIIEPDPVRRGRYDSYVDEDGVAVIDGPTPNWLAQTLDLHDRDPREEFYTRLRRMGVARALRRLGVEDGDTIRVGGVEVRWQD
ncbi:MAG: GTPase ObgE [Chloroflexi bacterium]|nr:GTPase ObgE [Chloroflexota bacterium]MDA1240257.1 GTPase ObgE [Chloroflexota bacterium]MQC19067.1 GTPase ObgE [Chloroflexota bacterium]